MTTQVAISHRTTYQYDRPIVVNPQVIRLRPAPHCRTPIETYSLQVLPSTHSVHWQQDPLSNFQARVFFPNKLDQFQVNVDLTVDMTVINPFDFLLDNDAHCFPFRYCEAVANELQPFLTGIERGPLLERFVSSFELATRKTTIDFLVQLNNVLHTNVEYQIRLDHGVQDCEDTLKRMTGSCRDTAWLLVQTLRHFGLASRFVSGYLVQLKPDEAPLDGENNIEEDSVDLHAWAEVFLPGAGWIGLDPTSGMLAGEGHIPLACSSSPDNAAPVCGRHETCDADFDVSLTVKRVNQVPRPSKPFSPEQWQRVNVLGKQVDKQLAEFDVRLTMGGEPTFVSLEDQVSAQWQTEAEGEAKFDLADQLADRLRTRFAAGGLLQFGQGKQYPGEALPRWAMRCYWRQDGEPMWQDDRWLAGASSVDRFDIEHAFLFTRKLAKRLRIDPENVGIGTDGTETSGYFLPLQMKWWESSDWQSEAWTDEPLTLVPGCSAMGYRLPLERLFTEEDPDPEFYPSDPIDLPSELPSHHRLTERISTRSVEPLDFDEDSLDQSGDLAMRTAVSVRQALCVEVRNGKVCVFIPPIDRLEHFLELIAFTESTAAALQISVLLEGYPPPVDSRIQSFAITPDPGVIEVNVQPAASWSELTEITSAVYEEARNTKLTADKFEADGSHIGTGGGNHVVLGATTLEDSPFLRRPDLLKSLIAYWHNHPSLSYFFSGRFVGPTCQAPRIDEGRFDSVHELAIALDQIHPGESYPAWYADRVLRRFLMDGTGNRHRSEFCIDKLFAPECSDGRMGLLELRAFEMPPHPQMSLVQQLLIRGLVAKFWESPYEQQLVHWGSTLHDRFMLPYFLRQDFRHVLTELNQQGMQFAFSWFEPQYEFRFPRVGTFRCQGVEVSLRQAIEPWYVIGDDSGGTSRYVDSSLERLQVLVTGMTQSRHALSCNGRRVPLHPTGVRGEFVAGVRFRAWQPPSCMHPSIPVDAPVTFDLVDTWMNCSLGGARYHVAHPGGTNPGALPVNGNEAESRRAARFETTSYTSGDLYLPPTEMNEQFPLTLDLRKKAD